MITSASTKKRPSVFYWDENGRRADKEIHDPILAGHHPTAEKVGREVAKEIGLTEAEINAIFGPGEYVEKD